MPMTTVSIIIPAYTLDRWTLIHKAVCTAADQSVPISEVVLCVDNNDDLLRRANAEWSDHPVIRVAPNRYNHLADVSGHMRAHGSPRRFGGGSARNSAAEEASADVLVFLDDDAWAEPDWIERLLVVYDRPDVVAVGGASLPDYETARPDWFPTNFDWVFGCSYDGLPVEAAPSRRLFGGNLSVRREAFFEVGGFQSFDFDDLDMCMRLAARYGERSLYYEPRAVMHHFVPAERVTWRYFCRRCFFVNSEKVLAFRDMGEAANLRAEAEFVWRAVRGAVRQLAGGSRGRPAALASLAAMFAGIGLAGAGHAWGRLKLMRASGGGALQMPCETAGDGS
jgi:glucosyl-dolichyl phosphate glucuronosyltransferase